MARQSVTRRDLLTYGAAGAGALLAGLPNPARAAESWGRVKRAKNIIFCVADGMSAAVPTMLDHYLQATAGRTSLWTSLMNEEYAVNGLQDTRSLTGMVTDSSAASSAWGSGVHIWNGAVNWLPGGKEGVALRPLLDIMKSEGKMRTGLVTTATVTHATPAGFAICHNNRDEEWVIADRYLAANIDVLMGGGEKFFASSGRKDKVDLKGKFAGKGFTLADDRDAMLSAHGKLLGLFASGHVPYTIDRDHDEKLQKTVPTLAEMATKAIQLLDGADGFILQVEGARVDHGGHGNDFAAQLFDQMAFDEALKAIVEWALVDGETLVVITSDHGNGNPGLGGAGDEYYDSTAGLLKYQGFKCSFGPVMTAIKAEPTVATIQGTVEDKFGVQLTSQEASLVASGLKKRSEINVIDVFSQDFSALAMVLSNHTHVGYMTNAHTSDHVLVTAIGPGCEEFHGLTSNVSYFQKFLSHRELKHQNPSVDYETAKAHYVKAGTVRAEDHWL
ncbi:MAG: alkaline phosphatase [Armatimonadetes bacterium]|nr:alkaline phosphatase [Armatimonadota bacterium]